MSKLQFISKVESNVSRSLSWAPPKNSEHDLLQRIHGTCWFIHRFDEMWMMSSRTKAVIVLLVSSKPIKTGLGLPNVWNNYHS